MTEPKNINISGYWKFKNEPESFKREFAMVTGSGESDIYYKMQALNWVEELRNSIFPNDKRQVEVIEIRYE